MGNPIKRSSEDFKKAKTGVGSNVVGGEAHADDLKSTVEIAAKYSEKPKKDVIETAKAKANAVVEAEANKHLKDEKAGVTADKGYKSPAMKGPGSSKSE